MISRINNSISHPIQSQSMHRASKVALAGIIALFAYLIANQSHPEIGNFLGRHQVTVIPVMTGIGVLALTYIFCVKPSQPSLPSLPRTSPPAKRIEENAISTTQRTSEQLARYQTLKAEFDRQHAVYLQNQTTIQNFTREEANVSENLAKMTADDPSIVNRERWNPPSFVIGEIAPFPIVNSDASPQLNHLVDLNRQGSELIQDLSRQMARQQEFINQMNAFRTRVMRVPLTERQIQTASQDIHTLLRQMNHQICDLLVRLCAGQKKSPLTPEEEEPLRKYVNSLVRIPVPGMPALTSVIRTLAVGRRYEISMNPQILKQLIFMAYNNQQFEVARNLLTQLQLNETSVVINIQFHHEVAMQILTNEWIPTFIECLEGSNLTKQVMSGIKLIHIATSMLIRCNDPVYRPAQFLADEMNYNESRLNPHDQRAFLLHHPGQNALREEIEKSCASGMVTVVRNDASGSISQLPYEFRLLNLPITFPEIRDPIFKKLIFGGNATLLQHAQNIGWFKIGMAKAAVLFMLKPSKDQTEDQASKAQAQAMLINTFYDIIAPSKVPFRTQTLESLRTAHRVHVSEPYNLLRNLRFFPNVYIAHLVRALNAIGRY